MKIERLLMMVVLLLNRQKVTAQELADLLHVSVRTVYRDIETLSCAGVPVMSQQGVHGGISLMDGYRMDKQVLTKDELASLAIAVKSVLTTYEDAHAEAVLEKLASVADDTMKQVVEQLVIDGSPWGQQAVFKEQMTLLKTAIQKKCCVCFSYSTTEGQLSERLIEPHTLVQKGKAWYLYGYCRAKEDFRLFKVLRMKNLQLSELTFERRELQLADLPWNQQWHQPQNVVELVLSFEQSILTLIEESFGAEHVDREQLLVRITLPENEWLYGFLLSFGHRVRILQPQHIKDIIMERAQQIANLYQ
ncbi:helix-turn-helix transcriptional regulator [Lysinibacillus piscis]|uniref:HTH-type transcriptional regulator YobV n=1 Tax=Lysinibacillus piscis TaxID=2518931 RepID=A0ABQ5NNF6_9BACI|nr:YafY family protein [Lysinibacillus sp. KH24]GLC89907.1 putative HTH-type transcriptional regulator YobV [Lysinibacillus sp. KH24]